MKKREIKFRAFDKEIKMYIPEDWIGISGEGKLFNNSMENCSYSCDSWILEQFTGLKDKNGKDIYDGDILQCLLRDKNKEFTGVVSMPKSCWVVGEKQDNGFIKYRRTANFSELEIIGNIHETH